jgi:protein-S-isoprenylcysteine O-methyltransferase Ste14
MGLPIVLLGEVVRTWSSGFLEKNVFLQTRGPYAMTRHPLYLGNIVIGVGFAFMGNSLPGGGVLLAGLAIIFTITMQEEEVALSLRFGKNYKDYVDRVPRLIPRLNRFDFKGFQWNRVMVNCELARWQRIVGGVLLFLVKGWFV